MRTHAVSRIAREPAAFFARASAEVEQLLASQEAMGMQYRAEARTIAERSEALVQELETLAAKRYALANPAAGEA